MIKYIIKKQIRKTSVVRELEKDKENLKTQINYLEKEKLNLIGDKLRLEEENEKLCTVPNFNGLNLSLKGKEGYLFLINDSNNEIRQHFDQSYLNNFNSSFFIEKLEFKKEYCINNKIKYFFFIVPDKSYVCRNLLPFDIKIIKRNYDLIKHLVPDFSNKLDSKCYRKTDTHINFYGGRVLSYNILNYIDNNFKRNDFDKLIDEQTIIDHNSLHYCDLLSSDNWSYSDEEKLEYQNEKAIIFLNKCLKSIKENLPEKFKSSFGRETFYYLNKNGFSDLKVLIMGDSSTMFLENVLSVYFKELLVYWDHWIFDKELVEWYKPDVIIDIRTERFLEHMEKEIINRNKEYQLNNK